MLDSFKKITFRGWIEVRRDATCCVSTTPFFHMQVRGHRHFCSSHRGTRHVYWLSLPGPWLVEGLDIYLRNVAVRIHVQGIERRISRVHQPKVFFDIYEC